MGVVAEELLAAVEDLYGAAVHVVRGLREGGSPWLLRAGDREVVLRVGHAADVDLLRVERDGLEFAALHDVPVARLLAVWLDTPHPALLIEAVAGSSAIPVEAPVRRLRALGAMAAKLHAIAVPAEVGLPVRERPISGVDFAALRAAAPPQPLLQQGERTIASSRPDNPVGFVHGDLWQGNALWDGDRLVAVIDWDCAGVGPAGVDLGSLRCDAAICFGIASGDHVLRGWESEAGRPAPDVAYWDVVAALCTPPDLGWFAEAIAGQGRADLTREVLAERRDAFLASALDAV